MKRGLFIPLMLFLALYAWSQKTAPGVPGTTGQKTFGGLMTPEQAKELLASENDIVLLDVRTADEFAGGHIPGAHLLPYDAITASSAAKAIPSKKAKIIVYCRSGRRSAIAVQSLQDLGYESVADLGGITSWPYEIVK